MFHTPPVKSDWKSETAINNSYDMHNVDSGSNYSDIESQPVTLDTEEGKDLLSKSNTASTEDDENVGNAQGGYDGKANADIKSSAIEFHDSFVDLDKHIESSRTNDNSATLHSDTSSFIESFEIPSEADLPMQLLKKYEQFLKELKEPKFERSLASFEIAELFQSFYQRFAASCKEYLEGDGRFELQERHHDTEYQFYKLNLTLERLLCDKFYSQIIFPLKDIEIDEYEKDFNDEFSDKLGCLGSLDIHFKHLDIELPEELEYKFISELDTKILPEFELFTAERSPTLKMKYLIKIHKKLGQLIGGITERSNYGKILNTDIYLPVLIFTMIKLKELRSYFLIRQLNLIKRFSNEHIFDGAVESLQIEKGKLLYVCANFEAAISYLASVTLENLDMEIPSPDINLLPGSLKPREELLNLLIVPLKLESLDEKVSKFKNDNPLFLNSESNHLNKSTITNPLNNFTNNWIDYSRVNLPDSVINADQGIKSISQTIDSSLKNIMGKVSWIGSSSDDILKSIGSNSNSNSNAELETRPAEPNLVYRSYDVESGGKGNKHGSFSESLLKQLAENEIFEKVVNEDKTTEGGRDPGEERVPLDATSGLAAGDKNGALGDGVDQNGALGVTGGKDENSDVQEGILSKLTTSVNDVMKNFRPLSESRSATSLDLNDHDASAGGSTRADGNMPADAQNHLERSTSANTFMTPTKKGSNGSSNNLSMSNLGGGLANGAGINSTASILANNNTRSSLMRSRAASFINNSFFTTPGSQSFSSEIGNSTICNTSGNMPTTSSPSPNKEYRSSIFSSLENAFDNVRNRSRNNSLQQQQQQPSQLPLPRVQEQERLEQQQQVSSSSTDADALQFKPLTKKFDDMSIAELRDMYDSYQCLVNSLNR